MIGNLDLIVRTINISEFLTNMYYMAGGIGIDILVIVWEVKGSCIVACLIPVVKINICFITI